MRTDSNKKLLLILVCLVCLRLSIPAYAEVTLAKLISDGMVIQRNTNVKIFGLADAQEKVTVDFKGKSYSTIADKDGRWSVLLDIASAGGPYTMKVSGENEITVQDIMIGDVWICSGQSNMELPMERVKYRYPDIIAASANPNIRQFYVPRKYDFKQPRHDFDSGVWQQADPEAVLQFTAVGYFFAKSLEEKYDVPIGLINTSLGGSPAEAWMSEEALKKFPEHLAAAMKFRNDSYLNSVAEKDKAAMSAWYAELSDRDAGLKADWYSVDYDSSGWPAMDVPGLWSDQRLGKFVGSVWYRKVIDVPASMTGKAAKLWLGRIVDADDTYLNGVRLGGIGYEWPPRIYDIDSNLLRSGRNVIAVRVVNTNSGRGGFIENKPYLITAGDESIDLSGLWQYKVGTDMRPLAPQTFIRWQPMGLYNAMIAPLLDYPITGVIWYQGESNTSDPQEYFRLFPALISNWRDKWNQGDFPFLYVQLANFMGTQDVPSESNWAMLRQAQLKTLSVVNTAMAVTIDIGEGSDIHPSNKQDVGIRLSLAAEKLAYGRTDVVYSGPIYESMKIEGNRVVLSFEHVGSGLIAKGGPLKYFAIAGADNKYVWANAKIEDDKVVVYSDEVENPVSVRYAWADNPEGANLYNKEGLAASPFQASEK